MLLKIYTTLYHMGLSGGEMNVEHRTPLSLAPRVNSHPTRNMSPQKAALEGDRFVAAAAEHVGCTNGNIPTA